ncbi:ankyrin [Trichoderma asperelloides]|nr:ankyrin [Trichoderma asperelloides]
MSTTTDSLVVAPILGATYTTGIDKCYLLEMEESSRSPSSTVRVSRAEDADNRCDDYIAIHSRLENNSADSISITYDHLFALFTTLARDVHRNIMDRGKSSLEQLANNDVGIVDAATTHIGEGGSFSVRSLTLPSPSTSIVLKSVLPVRDFTDREEQARLGAIILELRALSHQPLRNHRNIVKLLGLGWETDWEDPTRKWPVLIQECAYGTLDDLLEREPDLSYQHRLKLSLGISEGLLAIQCCGIAHGDLKLANVLIYPVTQHSISECRWIPKLTDFGGSVLDIPEGATGRLPMRSVPWQAPEWADYLTRDGLLRTDLYSLDLTIWSIKANGASPKLHLADTSTEGSKSYSHMAEQPNFSASSLSLNDRGDTILHFAASAGFEEVVRLWRAPMPVTVDAGDTDSETPLLLACRSGHGHAVRLLLDMGANPTIQSRNGDTPLHWPIRFEFAPLCNYEAGTPLHRAIGKGNMDAVRALLACGASAANAGGEGGSTPISLAADFHYAKILDTLLESVNDPLAATYPHAGGSLLAIAIRGDIIYGEKFSKIARHGQSWWQEACDTFDVIRRWGGDRHMRGFSGEMRSKGVFKLLLDNGADATQIHIDGFDDPERLLETHFACALRSRCFGIAKWLLDHGANPHREYQKALMIEMNHVSSVLGFIVMEQTTSSLAVFTHFDPSVEQINQKDINGRTAVWMAVARGNCYVTEQLLEGGADPRIKDAQGDNATDINNILLESSGGFMNADSDPRPIETQAGQKRKMRQALDKLLEPYKL